MKKNYLISASFLVSSFAFAQVGINTAEPKVTLDVVATADDPAVKDGITAPRITGAQLRSKSYGADQNGAFVYVTAADTAPAGQTIDVTSVGYYYFDSRTGVNKWIKFASGNTSTGADLTNDIWKDVVADPGTITPGMIQSTIGPARTETSTLTTGITRTFDQRAVYTDSNLLGLGTINPKGIFHTYSNNSIYFDKIGNGTQLFLRKSGNGSTVANPLVVPGGAGLGQFVMSGYTGEATADTGGWNESAGISIQGIAANRWSSTSGASSMRFYVTPRSANISGTPPGGQGFKRAAMQIEHDGRTIISNILPYNTGTLDANGLFPTDGLKGRFTIQDTTSDALYINAPLSDQSALSTGQILVWDSAGSTLTPSPAGSNFDSYNITSAGTTHTKGKVGTAPLTGLVKVSIPSTLSSAGSITETVVGGSSHIIDANTGIILTSPDGGKFKITVNNDGSLNSTKVTIL
ncbi:hypothetical protein ACKW6Q_15975 [Chryseobacterium kwangjuense]